MSKAKGYCILITLLLALVAIKYQSTETNPFEQSTPGVPVPGTAGSSTSSKYTCGEVSSTNPLWAYVTMLQNKKEGGGNASWHCNYCNIIYKGSYFRVKSHLLKEKGHEIAICSQVSNDCLEEMKKIEKEAMEKSKPVHVPLPSGTTSFNPSLDGGKRRRAETPIGRAFNNEARDHLSCEIARLFYSAGLPFNLARNPYFISAFSYAANNPISGFLPPSYNVIRTILLQREKTHILKLLQPIKDTWSEKGVSLVTDGWTDAQRRPLINFMEISDSGPMFLKAIDGSDNVHKAASVKEIILNDCWWDQVDYVLNSTSPIYDMLRSCDTDEPSLHLVYEKWDSMIEKVKLAIYQHEGKELNEHSSFYEVVYGVLIFRWTKSNTPLHCLAHSLNPRRAWPKEWWIMYGSSIPKLQSIALKLLSQPPSSSCCERNWSTYSFIHSMKRNRLNPKRAEDLVFIHTNLRLLSRKGKSYKEGESKLWDLAADEWDPSEGAGVLEVASLSLDEPDLEAVLFTDDGDGNDEIDTVRV
ncbi:Ribonuclease H-like superfamily [Sesbania bispinosa]|nr:Ribonuclease H-like superfamily [Sesbania bispinosa]